MAIPAGVCGRRGSVGGLSLQAAVGDGVQHGGHPGADLARRAHVPLVPGRGRQRGGLVTGPVPGEQRVQHPGQRGRVGRHRVLQGGSALCLLGAAAQGRVQAETGDLEAAGVVPAHRARGQPQVRPAGRCATARASAASAIMAAARAGFGSPDSTRSSRCVPGVHSVTMYAHCSSKSES